MKNLFKFIYLNIWKRITYYIGLSYAEMAQIRSVVEIVAVVVAFAAWRHINLTNRQILGLSLIVGVGTVIGGWLLEKSGGPQASNKLNNSINEELMEIVKWIREQKKK